MKDICVQLNLFFSIISLLLILLNDACYVLQIHSEMRRLSAGDNVELKEDLVLFVEVDHAADGDGQME